jgi:hypothetical protein
MLFALTKKGNHVWGTFLDEPNGPGMYLCKSPSLYHNKSNNKIKNIVYSTVAKELGPLATPSNIKDRVFVAWSYLGGIELKTLARLELGEPGMLNNPVDLATYIHSGQRYDSPSLGLIKEEDEENDVPVVDMD